MILPDQAVPRCKIPEGRGKEERGRFRGRMRQRERKREVGLSHMWTNARRSVHVHTLTYLDYPLTCVWSSSFPSIPWQKRSVWPCRAAPQRSPPLCHTLSSSPVGCRVACTQLQYKTEAPVYTHLCRTQMPTTNVNVSAKASNSAISGGKNVLI